MLDVALRVPCIFIIDAIFNSYYDPGSGWAGAMGKVLVRVMGECFKVQYRSLQIMSTTPDVSTLTASIAYVSRDVSQQLCHLSHRPKPIYSSAVTSKQA